MYKTRLKERTEVEKRLLQNLEDIQRTIKEKGSAELEQQLKEVLANASHLIDPQRSPRLAQSVKQIAMGMAEDSILPEAARKSIEIQIEMERHRLKSQFSEIQVTGVDDAAYQKSMKFSRAYQFVLILNTAPHSEWCKVFNKEYRNSSYYMKRDTRIQSDRMIMVVADSDDLQGQVDWIKGLVQITNKWVETEGFQNIDNQMNREKARVLDEFDAIQSMKSSTRDLKI
jgi:hypothetical protein